MKSFMLLYLLTSRILSSESVFLFNSEAATIWALPEYLLIKMAVIARGPDSVQLAFQRCYAANRLQCHTLLSTGICIPG